MDGELEYSLILHERELIASIYQPAGSSNSLCVMLGQALYAILDRTRCVLRHKQTYLDIIHEPGYVRLGNYE